jgi:hypothetical protein
LGGIKIRKGWVLSGEVAAITCFQESLSSHPQFLVYVRELHEHSYKPILGKDQHPFFIKASGNLHRL